MDDKVNPICVIYYSRTGRTAQAAKDIAQALNADLMPLHDRVDRSGALGFLKSGMEAMRKDLSHGVQYEAKRALADYDLVIIATPIWAGRCASPIRWFLERQGKHLHNVCYVLTRKSQQKYEDVYRQMDHYLPVPHKEGVSLGCDSVGYHFWLNDFLRRVKALLS